MAARLSTVTINAHDAALLAQFWSDVLGWKVLGTEDDGAIEIGGDDGGVTLLFEPVGDAKTVKNRVHFDVNPIGVHQDIELQRLLTLGAVHTDVGQDGTQTWVVLADPEGNEFCLLRSRAD